ncbi:hypothetical protein GCM10012286_34140 [Streptomyces lasiicapitis]|uniref:Uncharacterized protein n=1 Tax=Streptomyces lasiicapitis TaxID=1923961 RepID=A0ABQ2M134_9ACTN|nr:hypothetical protein GCM10012286_34140 [Streptomyces lasiicapitis]
MFLSRNWTATKRLPASGVANWFAARAGSTTFTRVTSRRSSLSFPVRESVEPMVPSDGAIDVTAVSAEAGAVLAGHESSAVEAFLNVGHDADVGAIRLHRLVLVRNQEAQVTKARLASST